MPWVYVTDEIGLIPPISLDCSGWGIPGVAERKRKVGGLTLPLNDCTEAGVQGLHSKEFHDFTCSEMHILVQ